MFRQLRYGHDVLNFRALLGLSIVGFGILAVSTATTATALKLSFGNKTPGTNLELCADTAADFAAGTCSERLSDSGGPGFVFLTITDTSQLSGKFIFVQRVVGITSPEFALSVE